MECFTSLSPEIVLIVVSEKLNFCFIESQDMLAKVALMSWLSFAHRSSAAVNFWLRPERGNVAVVNMHGFDILNNSLLPMDNPDLCKYTRLLPDIQIVFFTSSHPLFNLSLDRHGKSCRLNTHCFTYCFRITLTDQRTMLHLTKRFN